MTEPYGLPQGSAIDYGNPGFPPWVYDLATRHGLRASTYPGHQESDRPDIGSAPNPDHQNRGIDWAGDPQHMLDFAHWLVGIAPARSPGYGPPGLEMVIYQDPRTGEQVWYPDWVNFADDLPNHQDHVHTRQSASLIDAGPPGPPPEPKDTLFADVSEFQRPVDDSYPYRVLSIRSNDGTYRDHNFADNYRWCVRAADAGKLTCFIVYFYWRPNWQQSVDTHIQMVQSLGGPHPKMISMIDVESGGNPPGDFSDALNATDDVLVQWLGDPRRVIAYGNVSDLTAMWPSRRENQIIIAAYGSNPSYPGKIAHQYTDGRGYGGGLPEGAPPFGNCDMNSADDFTPTAFAAACGITATPSPPPPPPPPPTWDLPTDDSIYQAADVLVGQFLGK